jgi:hypothetical protein
MNARPSAYPLQIEGTRDRRRPADINPRVAMTHNGMTSSSEPLRVAVIPAVVAG